MPNLTMELALVYIRGLSSTIRYPTKHEEGERRLAKVLIDNCDGATHARLTIDEFEGDTCPSIEQIRAAAKRLGERCTCGKPYWSHREGVACSKFVNVSNISEEWTKTSDGGFSKFRQSIPMVEGVPWEVCLQVETIRIELGQRGTPRDHGALQKSLERYPEAVATINAGRDDLSIVIDYRLLEAQMRKLFPRMWRGVRLPSGEAVTVMQRLGEMDKEYAVESITSES